MEREEVKKTARRERDLREPTALRTDCSQNRPREESPPRTDCSQNRLFRRRRSPRAPARVRPFVGRSSSPLLRPSPRPVLGSTCSVSTLGRQRSIPHRRLIHTRKVGKKGGKTHTPPQVLLFHVPIRPRSRTLSNAERVVAWSVEDGVRSVVSGEDGGVDVMLWVR